MLPLLSQLSVTLSLSIKKHVQASHEEGLWKRLKYTVKFSNFQKLNQFLGHLVRKRIHRGQKALYSALLYTCILILATFLSRHQQNNIVYAGVTKKKVNLRLNEFLPATYILPFSEFPVVKVDLTSIELSKITITHELNSNLTKCNCSKILFTFGICSLKLLNQVSFLLKTKIWLKPSIPFTFRHSSEFCARIFSHFSEKGTIWCWLYTGLVFTKPIIHFAARQTDQPLFTSTSVNNC